MRFYRRLLPIKAISFDLDDTLYNNAPVLQRAENALLSRLGQLFPHQPQASSADFWQQQKRATLAEHAITQPYLSEDTSASRHATLIRGLTKLNHPSPQQMATELMAAFVRHRNQIDIAPQVVNLLTELAKKYPLAVITNGNAQVAQFLPQIRFASVQFPTVNHSRAKPAPDLFLRCCAELKIKPSELLHVGDHPVADVQGAINAGCQAALLTPGMNNRARPLAATLPTLEITDLTELLAVR